MAASDKISKRLTMGLRGRRALENRYSMQIACAKWHEQAHTLVGATA